MKCEIVYRRYVPKPSPGGRCPSAHTGADEGNAEGFAGDGILPSRAAQPLAALLPYGCGVPLAGAFPVPPPFNKGGCPLSHG